VRVLITGAAGMLGTKLARQLAERGAIGQRAVTGVDLVDVTAVAAAATGHHPVVADLAEPGVAEQLAALEPQVVFHLAGVVSGEAEADLAKGYRVNLDGTRRLFDALAGSGHVPRIVFTSSIAVFGAPFPEVIHDDFHLTPLTSYGTQKAMAEALLADYSRRGMVDGVGIRLPTISVRPGLPNAAASGFFSNIIREPLAGRRAALPVPTSVRHPHASPRSAVGFLLHAAELETSEVGPRRNLTMPSLSVTVQEQIEALARVGGAGAAELIVPEPDEAIRAMVAGWPRRFEAGRAHRLGFRCETSYDDIIEAYLEDDGPPPSSGTS
jgi:nucleoside-diphosphate-sugar epimerase